MGTIYNVANDGKVTLTNNLVVDTNVLYVDADNNRVGINKSPTVPLDVNGAVAISGNVVVDTNVLYVDANSNWVGINKVPAYPLDVTGDVNLTTGSVYRINGNAISLASLSDGSDAVLKTTFDAKGDLLVGTADNTYAKVSVSTNGYVLTANSAATAGISWDAVPAAGHVIQEEGTPLTARANLNFIGPAVLVTDDVGNAATKVTISGNGSVPIQEDFVATAGQTTFTVAQTFIAGQEWVFKNGRFMRRGASYDYTVSGQNVIFNAGLALDDKVTVQIITVLNSSTAPLVETFTASAAQTTFTLANSLISGQETVFANGVRKVYGVSADYTISGQNIVFNTGRNLGDVIVVELWVQTTAINSPQWRSFTVGYAALSAAALTNTIELMSLAAGEMIHNVVISHTASFTGGAISAYTVGVGIIGTLTKYANNFDVFQAPASNLGQVSATAGMEDKVSATSIKITATSVGANLNAATAGSVQIRVLVSKPF